ncbi:hypothetical protein FNV43_RR05777 [Rhamnella rubrinervis]|uniref:Uncharacterized protein n=1 Tax=Rhamnella rubrinervis TaxID=2594499 RepID=A0A8K0MRF8_9ROSA|nr:hypothetical protein FNV43_RR05777 [Rhamnella rubrinervis]
MVVRMSEPPFRPREKLVEKQKYFQSIQKHTYLKGPLDKVTSVAIPLTLAATSLFLIGRGIYNMSHGIAESMPKVKTNRVKYPDGWQLIEPTLSRLDANMREVNLFQLRPGYERLCCLRYIQPHDHNFRTTCLCRVPKHLREEKIVECVHYRCRGCASGD